MTPRGSIVGLLTTIGVATVGAALLIVTSALPQLMLGLVS